MTARAQAGRKKPKTITFRAAIIAAQKGLLETESDRIHIEVATMEDGVYTGSLLVTCFVGTDGEPKVEVERR